MWLTVWIQPVQRNVRVWLEEHCEPTLLSINNDSNPDLEPNLKDCSICCWCMMVPFAEGRRCSVKSHSGKRALGWHNLFGSSVELWARLRICHSMPTVSYWPPGSQNVIRIKAKGRLFIYSLNGIKEKFALTCSDNVVPAMKWVCLKSSGHNVLVILVSFTVKTVGSLDSSSLF